MSCIANVELQGRIVLTRDRTFMARRMTHRAYFVRAVDKREMVEEVVRRFAIPMQAGEIMSRCSICNGEFEKKTMVRRGEALWAGLGTVRGTRKG